MLEDRAIEDVEEKLRTVCAEEGIILSVASSSRVHDGSGERCKMNIFKCQRGGPNRQAEHLRAQDNGKPVPSVTSTVQWLQGIWVIRLQVLRFRDLGVYSGGRGTSQ